LTVVPPQRSERIGEIILGRRTVEVRWVSKGYLSADSFACPGKYECPILEFLVYLLADLNTMLVGKHTPRFDRRVNLRLEDGGAGPSEADGELILVFSWFREVGGRKYRCPFCLCQMA